MVLIVFPIVVVVVVVVVVCGSGILSSRHLLSLWSWQCSLVVVGYIVGYLVGWWVLIMPLWSWLLQSCCACDHL
jgi:hypothetical protein